MLWAGLISCLAGHVASAWPVVRPHLFEAWAHRAVEFAHGSGRTYCKKTLHGADWKTDMPALVNRHVLIFQSRQHFSIKTTNAQQEAKLLEPSTVWRLFPAVPQGGRAANGDPTLESALCGGSRQMLRRWPLFQFGSQHQNVCWRFDA
jgi:hypothetical protein